MTSSSALVHHTPCHTLQQHRRRVFLSRLRNAIRQHEFAERDVRARVRLRDDPLDVPDEADAQSAPNVAYVQVVWLIF